MKKIITGFLFLFALLSVNPSFASGPVAELKKWTYEACVSRPWKFRGNRKLLARSLRFAVARGMLKGAKASFRSIRSSALRFRSTKRLRTWRWNERTSSGRCRYMLWSEVSVNRKDGRTTVRIKIYGWDHSEIWNAVPIMKTSLGSTGAHFSGRMNRRIRRYLKTRVEEKLKKVANLLFYKSGELSRTSCTKHSDCGSKMVGCDAATRKCRKMRKSDLSRRARMMLGRFRPCTSSAQCYGDEICGSNGQCQDKPQSSRTSTSPKKCAPNVYGCGGSNSFRCATDGSRWIPVESCSLGCNTQTGRCNVVTVKTPSVKKTRRSDLMAKFLSRSISRNIAAAKRCQTNATRCHASQAWFCDKGRWYSTGHCSHGCDPKAGRCLSKKQAAALKAKKASFGLLAKKSKSPFGIEIRATGLLLWDTQHEHLTLGGQAEFQLSLVTKIGIIGLGGTFGVSGYSAVGSRVLWGASVGLSYEHPNVPLVFLAGFRWDEERVEKGALGLRSFAMLGPHFRLDWRMYEGVLNNGKDGGLSINMFLALKIPFKQYSFPVPLALGTPTVFAGISGAWRNFW